MPSYRLIFPPAPGIPPELSHTAQLETGDRILEVGDEVEHGGRRWKVSQAPLEQPESGETADLMLWPAD